MLAANQNEWNSNKERERLTSIGEPPLTPTNDGEVHFLGPETVKYISPPRYKTVNRNVPPPYQVHPMGYPHPMQPQQQQYHPQYYAPPQQPQYMQQMYAPQPIMYAPQPAVMMMPPPPTQIIQQIPAPVAAPAPLPAPAPPPPPPPQPQNINVVVNSSPTTTLSGMGKTGGNSTLLCPKCRSGIITRQEDKKRKKILCCLTIFCLPCTFGTLLCCLRCNYVDMCGACGKMYGHRGKKNQNTKVNAVTV